jgi:hypothetical protein
MLESARMAVQDAQILTQWPMRPFSRAGRAGVPVQRVFGIASLRVEFPCDGSMPSGTLGRKVWAMAEHQQGARQQYDDIDPSRQTRQRDTVLSAMADGAARSAPMRAPRGL